MKRLRNHLIGVEQGDTVLFSDFQNDGPMWAGQGPRKAVTVVRFSEPFRAPPAVHVALSMWDIEAGANQRADISAEEITAEGFEIVFKTWDDTRIARVRARWMAIGELAHEDDWEVG